MLSDSIRLLVLGTGQMGSGIARLIFEKKGLRLIGSYARRKERQGLDIGHAIGLKHELGIHVGTDLSVLLQQTRPHVAIQATCSTLEDAEEEIVTLVRHGVNVISIAEEMAFPACRSPRKTEELKALTLERGVSILGTGINPGFVLDLLVIVMTGVCTDIQSIIASRVNDLAPYGPSVLSSQGVGQTPEMFRKGVEDGTVVGHIGFPESIHMIAHALGWDIERIEEHREPIVSKVQRQTPFVNVEPGQVAGCFHTAIAYRHGQAVVTLSHPQQIHPQLEGVETGDSIEIIGTPNVRLSGSPEIPGGLGTCAIAVNMIPHILRAAPGVYSMADLPVPAAILGDARNQVRGLS